MWPRPESQWLVTAIALAVVGAAWLSATMFAHDRLTRVGNIVGGVGAGVAALGIAAALHPVPGVTAKEIMLLWQGSLGMIIAAIVMVSQRPSRWRWVFVTCGGVCLMLNVWAIAVLLWIATVSPGGV
jgi:hypothetical protein